MADLSSVLKLLEDFKVLQMFAGAVVLLVMSVVTLRATNENKRTKHIEQNGDIKADSSNVVVSLHMMQQTLARVENTMVNIDTNVRVMKERNGDYMDEIRDLMEHNK